jgi:hypothetical protein
MTYTTETHAGPPSAQLSLLIKTNLQSLRKALSVLVQIDDYAYTESPPGFEPHRVGGHLRHILEFYECFLDGLPYGRIDYDARRRNLLIQQSRKYAMEAVHSLARRLERCDERARQPILWVRMEDVSDSDLLDPFLASSIERELQVLSSHTIHHFALIAMTLGAHGIALDRDFGMAPSTLRHMKQSIGAVACAQ